LKICSGNGLIHEEKAIGDILVKGIAELNHDVVDPLRKDRMIQQSSKNYAIPAIG
jgi:hypothetical protein